MSDSTVERFEDLLAWQKAGHFVVGLGHRAPSRFAWIALAFFSANIDAAETFVCPEKVYVESARLKTENLPEGLAQGVSRGPMWLSGANVYSGPPELGAQLKPAIDKSSLSVWRFEGDDSSIWLSCDYAGVFHLYSELKRKPVECKASTRKKGPQRTLQVVFECKS